MKYATATSCALALYPAEKAFGILAGCGFDSLDYRLMADHYRYGVNNIVTGSELELMFAAERDRAAAEKAGITMWQLLAPESVLPVKGREDESKEVSRMIKRTVDVAAVVGARYVVIRPAFRCAFGRDDNPELTREMNFHFFSGLLEHARSKGIVLALMNLTGTAPTASVSEHIEYVDMMNSPDFVACLNTDNVRLSGRDAAGDVCALGDRLKVLNLNLNGNAGDCDPAHPQTGDMDWSAFFRALHEIHFAGALSLDCEKEGNFLPDEEKKKVAFLRAFAE